MCVGRCVYVCVCVCVCVGKIFFDEYIKIKDLRKQLIVSPPMDPEAQITPLGSASKYITIQIFDTLQPNTTYAFNFGESIVDNNEST